MVRKLRNKFITIAMLSTTLVLLLIVGGINIANYLNAVKTVDTRLNILVDNGGVLPVDKFYPDHNLNHPPKPEEADSHNRPEMQPDFERKVARHDMTKEMPFDTRFFTVELTESGEILSSNTRNIAAINANQATTYAANLLNKEKTSGFVDHYKFLATSSTDEAGNPTILYIFVDCERELNSVRSYLIASAVFSLVGLLLVFILIVVFSKVIMRPIAESYEKQKHFITDASHEIKTPLTIIDANTEILEMEQGENEWTESIRKQIKRLTSLTEKLVFLARMDEENTTISTTDFSLSDAILDTVENFRGVAKAKDLALNVEVAPDITMQGDEAQIRQMLSLLFDNAMKYTTEQGTITVTLTDSDKSKYKTFTISNPTDGLEKGCHDELFERFYRPDSSRSTATGGYGIGLSVVHAIVTAHKGKITATSDGENLSFIINLT